MNAENVMGIAPTQRGVSRASQEFAMKKTFSEAPCIEDVLAFIRSA